MCVDKNDNFSETKTTRPVQQPLRRQPRGHGAEQAEMVAANHSWHSKGAQSDYIASSIQQLTKNRRLLVRTQVVVGLVEQSTQSVAEHADECLGVFRVDETIRKDAKAFMDPESSHALLRVMEVFVCAKQTLKNL